MQYVRVSHLQLTKNFSITYVDCVNACSYARCLHAYMVSKLTRSTFDVFYKRRPLLNGDDALWPGGCCELGGKQWQLTPDIWLASPAQHLAGSALEPDDSTEYTSAAAGLAATYPTACFSPPTVNSSLFACSHVDKLWLRITVALGRVSWTHLDWSHLAEGNISSRR